MTEFFSARSGAASGRFADRRDPSGESSATGTIGRESPEPTTVAGMSCAIRRRVCASVAARRNVMNAKGHAVEDSELESADRVRSEMESKAGDVKLE